MKTIAEILQSIKDKKREQIVKLIDYCAEAICCEGVDWGKFLVYDASVENFCKILEKEQIQFLLPILSKAQKFKGREIVIFCNFCSKKEDEVWCVNVDAGLIHAIINVSKETAKMLDEK